MLKITYGILLIIFVLCWSCSVKKTEKQQESPILKISLPDIDNAQKDRFGYENIKRVEKGVCAFEMINDSIFIVADNFHKNLKIYQIKGKKVSLSQAVDYPGSVDEVDEVVYHLGNYLIYQQNGTVTTVLDSIFHEVKRFEKWSKGSVYSFWRKDTAQLNVYLVYVTNTNDGKENQFKIYNPNQDSFSEIDQKTYDHLYCVHGTFDKDRTQYFEKRDPDSSPHEIAMDNALGEDEIVYYKYYKNVLVGIVMNIYSKKVYFMSMPAHLVPPSQPDSMLAKTCPE